MSRRLTGIKNIIWAIGIAVSLLALLVGFFSAAVGRYYGDRERPVMNIGESGPARTKGEEPAGGTVADGKLHEPGKTKDAGQSYLDSLCFLCDSSTVSLRSAGLTAAQVWGSEDGQLPMGSADSWSILYPGDGSLISPANAAMIRKPTVLVIAVGGDGAADISHDDFVAKYSALIASVLSASPDTRILCCSLCSVTSAYLPAEGAISAERAQELSGWVKEVCVGTGAAYADLSSTLCDGGYLRPEYADAGGRVLSTAGLSALLGWLRTHAIS